MNSLRLLPVIISCLLLAAHFYRAGHQAVTFLTISVLLLLFLRERWVPRIIQIVLVLGALEWMWTLYVLVQMRITFGQPWARLAVILGAIALFTALSGLVFKRKALRKRYRLDDPG